MEDWHGTNNGYVNHKCRCDECRSASLDYQRARRETTIVGDEAWHGTSNGYDGYRCRCDACKEAKSRKSREYRLRRRESGVPVTAHGRAFGYNTHKCRCDDCRDWSSWDKRERSYGIGRDTAHARWESNARACEVCNEPLPWLKINVDHDHATGAFRGLLCTNCNFILGHARDDVSILNKAAQYLSDRLLHEEQEDN